MAGRGAFRVPDRWINYIPLGRRIPGTRFIAFKVPLKKSFDQNLHPKDRFSPRDLIKKIKERKEELGLIIDLTYTTRYYGPEELPATLCYSKIVTMGHQVPNKQTVFQFKCVVKQFLRDNKDNDKLIGVHCTHGLNRTGYLVCRYLIDVEGMEPNTAIELFNRARGHPIERTNYIQDLRSISVKKNCGLKNLGSGPFREKASSTPTVKKQVAKHHPPRSDQSSLATPKLLLSQQGNRECRTSGSTKKNRKQGIKAQTRHQELTQEHGTTEQKRPGGLTARNCRVSLPVKEQPNGLCFAPQNPHLCPPQETKAARKRKRLRKKNVVTA